MPTRELGRGWKGAVMMKVRVLEAYGRRIRSYNAQRLSSVATSCKLALTNTFFSARRDGIFSTAVIDFHGNVTVDLPWGG